MSEIAYASTSPEVLAAWAEWNNHQTEIAAKRKALTEEFGRRLMVRRSGLGHGNRVVGFEVFDGEADGLIIGDNGELRIPKTGPPYDTATPNLRRKAGKDLAARLEALALRGPAFPGMPTFALVDVRFLIPALFEHDGTIWARWSDEPSDPVDADLWHTQPLSRWHAAHEQLEAAS